MHHFVILCVMYAFKSRFWIFEVHPAQFHHPCIQSFRLGIFITFTKGDIIGTWCLPSFSKFIWSYIWSRQKYIRNIFILLFSVNAQDVHAFGCPHSSFVFSGNKVLLGPILANTPLLTGTLVQCVTGPKWLQGTLQGSSGLWQKCIFYAIMYFSHLDPTIPPQYY